MSGGIFLIDKDETLVEMTEQAYDSEDLLQALLENIPTCWPATRSWGNGPGPQ